MAGETNPDGIRRYEALLADVRKIADSALSIALSNSLAGYSGVLDIPHGGTGSNKKVFVDTYSNQFNIHGSKIFHDTCAFQKESDIVNSSELAGNVRLVVCDPQGADIGPQLRFSGRSVDNDTTAFAFATIAGRKYNSVSVDYSGYLQFAVTDVVGLIAEGMRVDHELNVGIGTIIPVKGVGNRLHLSGGNLFIDYIDAPADFGREIRLQIGDGSNPDVMGRVQALDNWSPSAPGKHLFLSVNTRFKQDGICEVDDDTLSTAGIEIFSDDAGSVINFRTSPTGTGSCICPALRGFFHDGGLEVLGNIIATPSSQPCGVAQGYIIAGGANNFPDISLGTGGTRGNCDSSKPGLVVGDNVHFGNDNPEGVVCAPIGAIYGRQDAPSDGETLYVKISNDYGPTGWVRVPIETGSFICRAEGCVDPNLCPVWYDQINNMLWFWDPDARGVGRGAWLSSQIFFMIQSVPAGEGGGKKSKNFAQDFRAVVNRHYQYFIPTHTIRNKRSTTGPNSGRFDLYIQDMQVTIRQAWNKVDPINNYYIFDLVTLKQRQGDPTGTGTKYQWPGNRIDDFDETDDDDFDVSDDDFGEDSLTASKKYNIVGNGHTFHPNLPTPMVERTVLKNILNQAAAARWELTIADSDVNLSATSMNTVKTMWYNQNTVKIYDSEDTEILAVPFGDKINKFQFRQHMTRDYRPEVNGNPKDISDSARPYNPGYIMIVKSSATPSLVGLARLISDNGPSGNGTIIVDADVILTNTLSPVIKLRGKLPLALSNGDVVEIHSVEHRRIIGRVTTRGNTAWKNSDGGYGLYHNQTFSRKVRDIQDFVLTNVHATTYQGNLGENKDDGNFEPEVDPTLGPDNEILSINYYLNLVNSEPPRPGQDDSSPPLDAVIVAGQWDKVGLPGRLASSICVSYRLALPGLGEPNDGTGGTGGTAPCV